MRDHPPGDRPADPEPGGGPVRRADSPRPADSGRAGDPVRGGGPARRKGPATGRGPGPGARPRTPHAAHRGHPARPDHGDRSMTRPDDPAAPAAAPERPAPAPERPAEIAARTPARRPSAGGRRGPADPVTSLLRHHRDLCERAVDPLEIAAGLEAHGLTDRTVARYRHRDVFALAEELYARMPPRAHRPAPGGPSAAPPGPDTGDRAAWTLLALLPGAVCLATAGALRATEGVLDDGARSLVTVLGALLACLALRACLGRGPLRAPGGAGRAGLYGCWLLSYAVYGEGLLDQVMTGGPDGPWNGTPAPLLGLAAAVAPAAWCTHLFTVRAHRKLAGSRAWRSSARACAPCCSPPSPSSSVPCCPCCTWPASPEAARRSEPSPSGSCSSWPGCSPRTDCRSPARSRSPPPAPSRPPPPPSSSPPGCPDSNPSPGP